MGENDTLSQDQLNDFLFAQLIMMFQRAAFRQMGKVMNPVTNKIERDLEQAKNSIDILGMLEAKTKGNLNDNEKNMLDHALYELRMNYVDETNKGPDTDESDASEEEAVESTEEPAGEAAAEEKEGESEDEEGESEEGDTA
jgi:hypothetical protein